VLKTVLDFLGRLLRPEKESAIVGMYQKLTLALETRLAKVEERLDAQEKEIDQYRTQRYKDQATIAELERRVETSERRHKQDEITIRELKRRIDELEAKNGGA
jgi:septal ring factor EnvC (AmiA/AmiB activator)